jgi:hypothetical protein
MQIEIGSLLLFFYFSTRWDPRYDEGLFLFTGGLQRSFTRG